MENFQIEQTEFIPSSQIWIHAFVFLTSKLPTNFIAKEDYFWLIGFY